MTMDERERLTRCVQPQTKTPTELPSLVSNGSGDVPAYSDVPTRENGKRTAIDLVSDDTEDVRACSDMPPRENGKRTVMDLVPIAKEMWKFVDRGFKRELTTAYSNLPTPIHNAVTKTTIYQFQRRQALPNDPIEYSTRAKFYMDLLKRHNQKLANEPFNLLALKCSYCSAQNDHIPGCCSFIRVSKKEDMPRLLLDALHQRLLHLRNNCIYSRREHGVEIRDLFNDRYNKEDPRLHNFASTWLRELDDGGKKPMNNTEQRHVMLSKDSNQNPQHYAQYALLQRYKQQQALKALELQRFKQQQAALITQRFNQQQQSLVTNPATFQSQYATNRHSAPLQPQQLSLGQHQQQPYLLQNLGQNQRQKPPPQLLQKRKFLFEELLKIYDEGQENISWSVFNSPYYPNDYEANEYFISACINSHKYYNDSGILLARKSMSAFDTNLPSLLPLPPPQKNLDYCLPMQFHEVKRYFAGAVGVPFVSSQQNSRKRPLSSSIVTAFTEIKPNDVVITGNEEPDNLSEKIHNLVGNRNFLKLVSAQRKEYITSSCDAQRLTIIKELIEKIQACGGSFLRTNTRISKFVKITMKETEDYIRFRLDQGFPDILNDARIWKRPRFSSISKGENATEPANSTAKTSMVSSKVLKIAHAPKIGLVNGCLEWNNGNSNNPIFKVSDLKIPQSHAAKEIKQLWKSKSSWRDWDC